MRALLLVCSIYPAIGGLAAAQEVAPESVAITEQKAPKVEEKATDTFFPAWFKFGKGDDRRTHNLVALGIRKKTIFKVKVYSFGLYLDAQAAQPKLQRFMSQKSKALLKDRNFDKAVLADGIGKTIRLVMVRDVDADDMAEAFEDSLKPRIKAYTKKQSAEQVKAATDSLAKFRGYFKKEAKDGQVMQFTALPGGRLLTSIDGKAMPEIKSSALSWALFDIYLGKDPISDSAKEKFVKGLPSVLKAAKGKAASQPAKKPAGALK